MYKLSLVLDFLIIFSICKGALDEKEALLRRAYGLGYPEPNVTFALCRGSWTSPAVSEFLNPLGQCHFHLRTYVFSLN